MSTSRPSLKFTPNVHAKVFMPRGPSASVSPAPAAMTVTTTTSNTTTPLSPAPAPNNNNKAPTAADIVRASVSPSPQPVRLEYATPAPKSAATGGSSERQSSVSSSAQHRFSYNPTARAFTPTFSLTPMGMLPPSVVDAIPPLNTTWSLYCILPSSGSFVPTKLHTVSDVKDFWNLMNNVKAVTDTAGDPALARLSLYLFREGIEPKWEDANNVKGGQWQVTLPANAATSDMDDRFQNLCSWAVSEPEFSLPSDTINGIGLKIRDGKYTIEVWTRSVPGPHRPKKSFVEIVTEACRVMNVHGVRGDYYVHADREKQKHAPPTIQQQIFY